MRVQLFIIGLFSAATLAQAASNDLTGTLQKGLFEEEANHNLNGAIQAYQSVVSQFDKDRKLVATAIFRLGECYRKQGNTNDAAAQYQRVVREFADQAQLVTLSRQNLAALGAPAPAEGATLLPSAARQEQKRLLQEEIKLVENKLAADQKRVETGAASHEELWATQREILKLKRQLAAIDAGQPLPTSAGAVESETVPVTSVEAEEIKRIQAMIKDSPDLINAREQAGQTPLRNAAAQGQLTVATFLLDHGAEVDPKDNSGQTPLHCAAINGHKAIVELLLSHKANVQSSDYPGMTPLHYAARKGFRSVAEVLLAHGADANAKGSSGITPLHDAAINGYKAVAELLLEHGADVNALESADLSAPGSLLNGSALHLAAGRGDQPLTELLLANKADPNAVNRDGETPLDIAARLGKVSVAAALISHGADVNARNANVIHFGWTPLVYAVDANQTELVSLLLKNKADPNSRYPLTTRLQERGYTPLLMSTFRGFADVTEALLDGKADPNLRSEAGTSALINALSDFNRPGGPSVESAERQRMVKALLQHGADPNARDLQTMTALMLAAARWDAEDVNALLEQKADVSAQDRNGSSALHYTAMGAITLRSLPVAEALLAHGADVNLPDNTGMTPLKRAIELAGRGLPAEQKVAVEKLEDLLRGHGAVAEVPQLDRIQVCRPSSNYSAARFSRGTNDWNEFTLLDLLGVQYSLLAALPQGEPRQRYVESSWVAHQQLPFPDLARLRIRRPAPDGKDWEERRVDLSAVFEVGDCSKNVSLSWGDVVEIPESVHRLGETWQGFGDKGFTNLKKCLAREVEVIVNDKSNKVMLAPDVTRGLAAEVREKVPFWIKPALRESHLLLTSSDLAHVKVTRHDPVTGQKQEWVLDCSDNQPAPDLWLRDGDVIEVPEKQ